jgi:hypothetical protein
VLLDIAPAAFVVHADGAEHDQERGGGNPSLSMGELRDLSDQGAIGDHAKHPRLFIPAGWGETRRFEHFLDHFFGDGSLLELADTDALLQ